VSVDTAGGHSAMDYKEHVRTYGNFLKLVQITIGIVAVIMISMAVFLL